MPVVQKRGCLNSTEYVLLRAELRGSRNRGEFEPHLGDDYLDDSERSESENVQFD